MTSYFGRADIDSSENFLRDIRFISSFSKEDIQKIVIKLQNWLLDDSATDSNEIIEEISRENKIKFIEAQKLLSITKFLFDILGPDGEASDDSTKDLVADLVSSEVIDKELSKFYKSAFDGIRATIGSEYLMQKKKEKFKSEGLPRIVGLTGTVNLRAIIEHQYRTDMDITSYSPNITGFVPIATLRLRATDDSPTENFYCQIDKKALRKFIEHLCALEIEMEAIEKSGILKDA